MPMLQIERVFDAPRELVFNAWIDPAQFAKWWGPGPFTGRVAEFDVRPGGRMLYGMVSPDGTEYWNTGTFEEIVPPERLVIVQYFSDPEGNRVSPTAFGLSAEMPAGVTLTVTFEALGTRTKMTLVQSIPLHIAEEVGAIEGWSTSLDKLEALFA